jgi:peptidoglycan/xylan/chitin deacetylase (PgdA/CDA1 family)
MIPLPATPAIPTLSSEGAAGQTEAVPILMYHYVRPDPGPNDPIGQDLSVTPEDFAEEMQYLADRGYTTMTLGELADVRDKKLKLPAKPVVLTFDDGYRDFYTNAWPVLRQHKFKATIFVITGFVNQDRYLTWDMIRELDQSGYIEVGSHTVHHVDLSKVAADVANAEVTESKQVIEQEIGHPIQSFCYPSGRYTASVVSQLRQVGYTIATTTNGGFSKAGDDQLLLPRVRIHGTSGLQALKSTLP